MKKRILTLSILTLAATAAGAFEPAMAQGARFQFEPNTWAPMKNQKRQYQNFNPPMTSVGHGMVPKASTFLGGVDPSVLKPAPKPQPVQPMVATHVTPQASWGQPQAQIVPTVPKSLAAPAYSKNFGNPMQNAPVVAHQPPAQQLAQPTTSRGVSGRMMPKRASNSTSKTAVSGRLVKPKQPSSLNAQPKVASYGNQFFSPGSTKPQSSGYSSKSDVYGQILNRH